MFKFKVVIFFILLLVVNFNLTAQVDMNTVERAKYSEAELQEYKLGKLKEHAHSTDEYIFVPVANERIGGTANTQVVPQCSNMDFETGTFQNWTRLNGFNPLFNAQGCCTFTNNLDITLMTGAGLDPYGGFPVVCPSGGSVTARLGSTTVGGRADRLEQTFSVSATNPILKINYAAVLNDGGHAISSQPRIIFEIFDTLGYQVPCAFLNLSTSPALFPWLTSTVTSNVQYSNWRSYVVDLSPYLGQKLTFQATVYDCGPSGHFGYTYLDIECINSLGGAFSNFCASAVNSICLPFTAPYGSWLAPGGTVSTIGSCFTPSTSGVYTIIPNGSTPSCGQAGYTYTVTILPGINVAQSISDTTSCTGLISFTSTINSGTTAVNGLWYFGDASTSSSLQTTHTYSAPGNYTASFVGINTFGCRDSISQLIRVFPQPSALFLSDTVCEGNVLNLTNLSTIAPQASIASSAWYGSFGTFSTSSAPGTQTFNLLAGTYPITLTINSSNNCSATFSQTALVLPTPSASINLQAYYCAADTITYSYSGSISSGSIVSSLWSLPLLTMSPVASPTQVIFSPNTYTATLSVSSASACTYSTQTSFSVMPLPTVAVSSGSICAGSSFVIIPNGATTYSISGNTFTVSPPFSSSYSVIGWSAFGCQSANSATALVSVVQLPTLSINSGNICLGDTFTIVPNGASNYTISGNNYIVTPTTTSFYNLLGSNQQGCYAANAVNGTVTVHPLPTLSVNSNTACIGSTYSIQANGAQQYTYSTITPVITITSNLIFWVVGQDTNNCISTVFGSVIALPNPTISASQSSFAICKNESTMLTASGAQAYQWSNGSVGNLLQYSTATVGPGTLFVIGSLPSGCFDTAFVNYEVYPLPSLTVSSVPKVSCIGETATLSALGASSYSWSNGFTTPIQIIQPNQTTTFVVSGYNSYGCKNSVLFAQEVDICESIQMDDGKLQEVSLYPSPSSDYITFKGLQPEKEYGIIVYDASGKLIYQSKIDSANPYVSLAQFTEGIYLCRLMQGNSFSVHRIIKQN